MATYGVFEDRDSARKLLRFFAEQHGHECTVERTTLAGALGALAAVHDGTVQAPDVWILDGHLDYFDGRGSDVRTIVASMRELGIPGVTIGFSSDPMSRYGVSVDYDTGKDAKAVVAILDGLDAASSSGQ